MNANDPGDVADERGYWQFVLSDLPDPCAAYLMRLVEEDLARGSREPQPTFPSPLRDPIRYDWPSHLETRAAAEPSNIDLAVADAVASLDVLNAAHARTPRRWAR